MTEEASLNLFQQQDANRRRTVWLIVCFVLFFAWLGFGGDYIYSLSTAHSPPAQQHHVWWFGVAMLALGALLARYAYQTGAEKVLWATGAQEVIDPADDQEKLAEFVHEVEERRAGDDISDEEWKIIEARVARRDLATDEEVDGVFRRYRSA